MITLVAGHELAEHDSPPGDATLQVLRGRVRFVSASASVELAECGFLPIRPERHSVAADEDAVLLLTVVKR
jgi:quercetin dioxygenase-like cupin family protein